MSDSDSLPPKKGSPPTCKGQTPRQGEHPCSTASKASYKCLSDHHYDRSQCQGFFDAYKVCMADAQEAIKKDRIAKRKSLFG